ncbi:MAG TPA: hypothetical protein VF877_11850 [Gaiellaceae bacterium]
MSRFRHYLRQLGLLRNHDDEKWDRRDVDNVDAGAAAQSQHGSGAFKTGEHEYPPDYVKSYDEGRPPH